MRASQRGRGLEPGSQLERPPERGSQLAREPGSRQRERLGPAWLRQSTLHLNEPINEPEKANTLL